MNKGGDASCPGPETHQSQSQVSNAAPTFNPKGCGTVTYEQAKLQTENVKKQNEARKTKGTVAWLMEELQKWSSDTKVYVDFDREGGNETKANTVEEFNMYSRKGLKIS